MIFLVPMTPEDFRTFAQEAVPTYAAEKVAAGDWTAPAAPGLARDTFERLLPRGLATPDHFLFTIRDGTTTVGWLWSAIRNRGSQRIVYVFYVHILPGQQRKGYAKRTFTALEAKARSLGLAGIALHVFGHNVAARGLYTKLGYQPTDLKLFKTLAPSGDRR